MPEPEQYEPISAYSSDIDNPTMEPARDGGWVSYRDHLTALQQQRKQVIAEVEEALTGDEAVEAGARAQWELSDPDADHEVAPKKDHAGGWEQAGNGARFLYRGNARCVLLASLDSDQEGDDA